MRTALSALMILVMGIASVSYGTEPPIQCETWIRFSPKAGAETKLVQEISSAKDRILVAIYGLTNPRVVDALIIAKKRKVDVRIKADQLQSGGKRQRAQIGRLAKSGISVEVSKLSRQLHNKFAIIDGKRVITGSYNFTLNGELKNKENLVVLNCPEVAKLYEKEYELIE